MTIFRVRDLRNDPYEQFHIVKRETYKKMIRIHDRSGQPFRVETTYFNGTPTKNLTLL